MLVYAATSLEVVMNQLSPIIDYDTQKVSGGETSQDRVIALAGRTLLRRCTSCNRQRVVTMLT
jgi:hypothetical protein